MPFTPLTKLEEETLVRACKGGDTKARDKLIASVYPFVVSEAKRRANQFAELDDLVEEGSLGAMHAIALFDLSHGTRLLTYAAYWIRQYINRWVQHESVLLSHKAATRHRLNRIRQARSDLPRDTANEAQALADHYKLPVARVIELLMLFDSWKAWREGDRLGWGTDDNALWTLDCLPGPSASPEDIAIATEQSAANSRILDAALARETPRDRAIIAALWLDRRGTRTLAEVGHMFGISRERVRQIQDRFFARYRRRVAT